MDHKEGFNGERDLCRSIAYLCLLLVLTDAIC
jgi:hypothetical protein